MSRFAGYLLTFAITTLVADATGDALKAQFAAHHSATDAAIAAAK